MQWASLLIRIAGAPAADPAAGAVFPSAAGDGGDRVLVGDPVPERLITPAGGGSANRATTARSCRATNLALGKDTVDINVA